MRKYILLFLALGLLLTLAAPGLAAQEPAPANNVLIVCFSRHGSSYGDSDADAASSASLTVGNTLVVADMIEALTGGDRFQIVTVNPYPKDYIETTEVATTEKNADARPELTAQIENMDDYDTVILGYPIWWGTIPMPVASFLAAYDFSGKTILPFCTHEGSSLGGSERSIAELVPDATVRSGLAVRGGSATGAQNEVEAWLRGHGLIE